MGRLEYLVESGKGNAAHLAIRAEVISGTNAHAQINLHNPHVAMVGGVFVWCCLECLKVLAFAGAMASKWAAAGMAGLGGAMLLPEA
jgi:hypothetical protein